MGSPPTLRNARTGELTPPGMYLQASWYKLTSILRLGSERCARQAQADCKAAARMIVRPGEAAMGFHDLGRNGQPDPLAAGIAVARFRHPIEGLEYTLQVGGRHAGAVI